MKKCTKCKEKKRLDEFYRLKKARDGRRPDCKNCCKRQKKDKEMEDPVLARCKRMGFGIIKRLTTDINRKSNKTYKDNNVKSEIGSTGNEIAEFLYENYYKEVEELINDGEIPTVDRIDSSGNYSEDNIRIISFKENSLDGVKNAVEKTSKETTVIYPDGTIRKFPSVSAVSRELGKKRDTIIRNRDNDTETRDGYRFI